MLRLATLDVDGGGPATLSVPPALLARAIGDLASERLVNGTSGFAIEQLCAALVADAPRAGQACVDRLLDCGVGVEALYDVYIPRAAARLGEMWLEDTLPFAGVTLGMARLTEVFRRLGPRFLRERERPGPDAVGRRALLALAPGESHALGVVMAADYFQRAGWSVRVELMADAAGIERLVRARPYDLVGVSAGSRRRVPEVRALVARLRAAARPGARFALGGPLVWLDPDVGAEVGVDMAHASAVDALEALDALERSA
jgi:methylmalonyl-CoA mutase cobalamin-binding subunit